MNIISLRRNDILDVGMSFSTRQPGNSLYTALTVILVCIKYPVLLFWFFLKSLRQHPNWTYRQAWGTEILKLIFSFSSTIEYCPPRSLDPGSEKERFVKIKPASNDLYRGVLKDAEIQPTMIGGVWHPKLFDARDNSQKKTILHFHGGAYVLGDCRDANTTFGAGALTKSTSAMVFCPQYRLSSGPKGRFPAALQDAVTAYQYLLGLGIPATSIVISGDSAGGYIIIALLRYFHDNEEILPLPSAVLLWSPWVDLETDPKSFDHNRNIKTDFVTSVIMTWGIESFKPSFMRISNLYLTPRDSPFPTPVPMFVQLGGGEVLYDVGAKFVENMKKVQGNKIELYKSEYAPYAILLYREILGFQKEANAAANTAEWFLKAQGVSASS